MDMPPGGMETELGQGGRGERVNGREGRQGAVT